MNQLDPVSQFAKNLYDKIRVQGSDLEMRNEEHGEIKDEKNPVDARYFQFKYGDSLIITMEIIEATGGNTKGSLIIRYDGSLPASWTGSQKKEFIIFLQDMKEFCQPDFSFVVKDINISGGLDARNLRHKAAGPSSNIVDKDAVKAPPETSTQMSESRLTGSRLRSYEDKGSVRIVAKHKRPVDESRPGDRSRNIECIYVENDLGERFRLPEGTTINGARAYARHMLEGGALHDEFGQHITKMISEMNALKGFVRNMRGRQFEDVETSAMVESAIDHYGALHRDLFTLRGRRGYEQYKALWQPEQPLTDDFDIEALKERFVKRVFDDRLTDALPIVHKAYETRKSRIEEEFEEWANQVAEQGLEEDIMPSTDAGNMSPLSTTSPKIDPMDGDEADAELDSDDPDEEIDKIFSDNGFDFFFQDGTYWFESKEELERAKDILVKHALDSDDQDHEFPKMGVRDVHNDMYGSATFDRDLKHGVMEDLQAIQRLAGLGK